PGSLVRDLRDPVPRRRLPGRGAERRRDARGRGRRRAARRTRPDVGDRREGREPLGAPAGPGLLRRPSLPGAPVRGRPAAVRGRPRRGRRGAQGPRRHPRRRARRLELGPAHRRLRTRAHRAQALDDVRPHRVRPRLEPAAAERRAGARERRHAERRALLREGVAMRILGISGSLRVGSHNTRLLHAAAGLLPDGVELELFEGLRDVPPYDEDADVEPAPAAVARLRAAIADADALLISTPEYNSSVPGQLKNALDWASRPRAAAALRDKPVAVVGASAGAFGA